MTDHDDRASERHTHTEQFLQQERRQRLANLATALVLATCGVPLLREPQTEAAATE